MTLHFSGYSVWLDKMFSLESCDRKIRDSKKIFDRIILGRMKTGSQSHIRRYGIYKCI